MAGKKLPKGVTTIEEAATRGGRGGQILREARRGIGVSPATPKGERVTKRMYKIPTQEFERAGSMGRAQTKHQLERGIIKPLPARISDIDPVSMQDFGSAGRSLLGGHKVRALARAAKAAGTAGKLLGIAGLPFQVLGAYEELERARKTGELSKKQRLGIQEM